MRASTCLLPTARLLLSLLLLLIGTTAWAQGLTNSPYTYFGIGDLQLGFTARNQAMAGVNIATFDFTNINKLNPASYADVGVTTIDISGTYQATTAKTTEQVQNLRGGQLNGIYLAFPTRKRFTIGMGLAPYSNIDYSIFLNLTKFDGTSLRNYNQSSSGNGGLNEAYLGTGFRLMKGLSFGFHARFLFGDLRIDDAVTTAAGSLTNSIVIINQSNLMKGIGATLGLQYSDTLSANWLGKIGLIFETPINISSTQRNVVTTSTNLTISDTLVERSVSSNIPARYGLGFGAVYKNKMILAADFTMQDWRNFSYPGRDLNLDRSYRFATAAEIIPRPNSLRYYERVSYRAGLYYEQTYLRVNGTAINNLGATFGLGFPLTRQYTTIHLGSGLGVRGTTSNGNIRESYFQLFFGVSFNEFWFVKRAYD